MLKTTLVLIQRSSIISWLTDEVLAELDVRRFSDVSLYKLSKSRIAPSVIMVSDLGGSLRTSLEAVTRIRENSPAIPIVFFVTHSCEESAIAALRAGVHDYLRGPATPGQVLEVVRRFVPRQDEQAFGPLSTRRWIGESAASRSLLEYATRLAMTKSTVLIVGETGTGKDLAAELVHTMSPRKDKPFVALNCAAIPDSLLESELFGREKGAYTGADTTYEGRLKLAEGGTVFLDEIGDLTSYGQAKLLRVLENRQAQRLGATADIPLNIRIVAATNQDLRAMVDRGQFRRDLYYRLNVARLDVPPLRDRREDIVPLLQYFSDNFSEDMRVPFPGFSAPALEALVAYDWPGNVRELRNVVEEVFVRISDFAVGVEDLPFEISGIRRALPVEAKDEKSRIVLALRKTNWNKKRAAERLCWSRMTLYRKMAFYHIGGQAPAESDPGLVTTPV